MTPAPTELRRTRASSPAPPRKAAAAAEAEGENRKGNAEPLAHEEACEIAKVAANTKTEAPATAEDAARAEPAKGRKRGLATAAAVVLGLATAVGVAALVLLGALDPSDRPAGLGAALGWVGRRTAPLRRLLAMVPRSAFLCASATAGLGVVAAFAGKFLIKKRAAVACEAPKPKAA